MDTAEEAKKRAMDYRMVPVTEKINFAILKGLFTVNMELDYLQQEKVVELGYDLEKLGNKMFKISWT
jgi:hypothetical protein